MHNKSYRAALKRAERLKWCSWCEEPVQVLVINDLRPVGIPKGVDTRKVLVTRKPGGGVGGDRHLKSRKWATRGKRGGKAKTSVWRRLRRAQLKSVRLGLFPIYVPNPPEGSHRQGAIHNRERATAMGSAVGPRGRGRGGRRPMNPCSCDARSEAAWMSYFVECPKGSTCPNAQADRRCFMPGGRCNVCTPS
jgi:hypothetical protein